MTENIKFNLWQSGPKYMLKPWQRKNFVFLLNTHFFIFQKELLADIIINITNISKTRNKWWGKYNEECSGFIVINTKEQCNNLINVSKFGEVIKVKCFIRKLYITYCMVYHHEISQSVSN